MTAPAAKLMHHNYIGGLLVHTLECIELAKMVIKQSFQRINEDNAIAAALEMAHYDDSWEIDSTEFDAYKIEE